MNKRIFFTEHALEQIDERGATRDEVELAVRKGEKEQARGNRTKHKITLPFNETWIGKHYAWKQVVPIVVEEKDEIVVITVLTFYF